MAIQSVSSARSRSRTTKTLPPARVADPALIFRTRDGPPAQLALQQRADCAMPGEGDGSRRVVAVEHFGERAEHPPLRVTRRLPARDRRIGLGEQRVRQLFEARRGNETGTAAVVLVELIPAVHRRSATGGEDGGELEGLGFRARDDPGRAIHQWVVRKTFRARLAECGKPPAGCRHLWVDHHLGMGDIERVHRLRCRRARSGSAPSPSGRPSTGCPSRSGCPRRRTHPGRDQGRAASAPPARRPC